MPPTSFKLSKDQSTAGGALGGAVIGGIVGGPPGLIIGAILGGLGGRAFGHRDVPDTEETNQGGGPSA